MTWVSPTPLARPAKPRVRAGLQLAGVDRHGEHAVGRCEKSSLRANACSERFGRVLDVNAPQRAPTRPKSRAAGDGLSDRFHWAASGDVAASISLITQRSLVQIQPPQPNNSRGYGSCRSPLGF